MAVRDIGYEQDGFHWDKAEIDVLLHPQSADIAQGVDANQPGDNKEEGAGDQGIMFGYACNETPTLMPAPIYYAHKILEDLAQGAQVRQGAGGEARAGLEEPGDSALRERQAGRRDADRRLASAVVEDLDLSKQVRDIIEPFVRAALPEGWIGKDTVWHINPTGKFFIGGPDGDSGLTGRKIIVDTYGGAAPHGGGAFSGKDFDQGRPLGGLRRALSRQERRRRGPRRPLHAAAFLRHRRRAAAVDLRRPARDGKDRRRQARDRADGGDEPDAARHPPAPRSSTGRSTRAPRPTAISAAQPDADGGFSWEKTDLVDKLKGLA